MFDNKLNNRILCGSKARRKLFLGRKKGFCDICKHVKGVVIMSQSVVFGF
jgi:hypothetical protein